MKIKKLLVLTIMFLINQIKSDFMPKQSEYPPYTYCLNDSANAMINAPLADLVSSCLTIYVTPLVGEVLTSIKIDEVERKDYLKQLNPPQNKPQYFNSSIQLPKTTKTVAITGSMGSTGFWTNPNLPIPTDAVGYSIPINIAFQG